MHHDISLVLPTDFTKCARSRRINNRLCLVMFAACQTISADDVAWHECSLP